MNKVIELVEARLAMRAANIGDGIPSYDYGGFFCSAGGKIIFRPPHRVGIVVHNFDYWIQVLAYATWVVTDYRGVR